MPQAETGTTPPAADPSGVPTAAAEQGPAPDNPHAGESPMVRQQLKAQVIDTRPELPPLPTAPQPVLPGLPQIPQLVDTRPSPEPPARPHQPVGDPEREAPRGVLSLAAGGKIEPEPAARRQSVAAGPAAPAAAPPPQASPLGEPVVLIGNPKLRSEPRAFPEIGERVPDSIVDGGEVDGLIVRAASLRGDDHRHYAETRQDSFGLYAMTPVPGGPVFMAAVADGVGSETWSHIGSAAACRLLAEEIGGYAEAMLDPARENRLQDNCQELMDKVAGRLAMEADSRDLNKKQLSTTLVGCLFGPAAPVRRAVMFAVGDSPAYVLRARDFQPVFTVEQEEIASSGTNALPTQIGRVSVRVAELCAGDMVLLCTDGLGNTMRTPAVRRQLAEWWGEPGVPGLPAYFWQLSFRAQSYGDDRTAVCVWVR
ncbi:protein phosphatase 2C domain-containing protein [Hamadaea tsunoensis]|uniref:protein phosphatase 2C domain-containing protein n=1 Tax=Hamadaea tsunoensis TaxID=53368 RepID=UPI000482EFF9|nr:protein phosphatase 2C domain-containing protein [Hamadaea tsunoensis]